MSSFWYAIGEEIGRQVDYRPAEADGAARAAALIAELLQAGPQSLGELH